MLLVLLSIVFILPYFIIKKDKIRRIYYSLLYIIGCIIVVISIPGLFFNTKINNPTAMIAFIHRDASLLILSIGTLIMLPVNIFFIKTNKLNNIYLKLLSLLPSIICFISLIIVMYSLLNAYIENKKETNNTNQQVIKEIICTLNNKEYNYEIIYDKDLKEYVVATDEHNNNYIDIDYQDETTIEKTIKNYYETKKGSCK